MGEAEVRKLRALSHKLTGLILLPLYYTRDNNHFLLCLISVSDFLKCSQQDSKLLGGTVS